MSMPAPLSFTHRYTRSPIVTAVQQQFSTWQKLLPLDDSPAAGSSGFSSALSLHWAFPGQIENCWPDSAIVIMNSATKPLT
jgi:hypothetical protein